MTQLEAIQPRRRYIDERSELAKSAGRIRALYMRHSYEMRHSPPGVFDMLFWPAVDLILWGLLTVYIEKENVELPLALGFLIGGVLLWDLVFRSNLGIGVTFLDDTSWTHNILNLMVSPLRPSEYIIGTVLWSFTKVAAGWSMMLAAAWALFGFDTFRLGASLALFVLALMVFGTALGMIVVGIVLRFGPGADILAWGLAVIFMPISAVFYPVDALPGWGQAIAAVVPAAHVFEAMRTVLGGDPMPWGRLAVAFALDAVYLFGGLVFARSMFNVLRRRGYVTRYMT